MTSATITSLFSDNNVHSSVYVKNDARPEEILSLLKKILIEIDNDGKNGRLNWNYFSSRVLAKIVLDGQKRETLSDDILNMPDFDNLSYRYEIKPIAEKYTSTQNDIIDTINVKIYDNENSVIVDKLLSSIKNKDLLTKDDFVFKDLNQEDIINYLNNKDNFKNITSHDEKRLSLGYRKSDIEETLEIFNDFEANTHMFLKNTILNSGYEILRADDWIIVSYLGCVEKLVNGYELTNGITTPKNDMFIIVGHEASITVQDDGTVFMSSFN